MNTHIMSLNPDAFLLIKNGTKTIEMRLFDEKRKAILKGDYIVFVDTSDANNQLKVKVKEVYKYNNFDELYRDFDKIELGYYKDDVACPRDMEKYYAKEDIDNYGVIGIEIEQ